MNAFQVRIEKNLALISRNETDKFEVISAQYTFDETCQLCGKTHLSKTYTIKNLNTNIEINVGCECVHHFKHLGVDIDIAEGKLKLVEESIKLGKQYLVNKIGNRWFNSLSKEEQSKLMCRGGLNKKKEEAGKAYFKEMSPEEKRKHYVAAYNMQQAERMFQEDSRPVYVMESDEFITQLDFIDARADFEKDISVITERKKGNFINRKVKIVINDARLQKEMISDKAIESMMEQAKNFGVEKETSEAIERYRNELVHIKKSDFLYQKVASAVRDVKYTEEPISEETATSLLAEAVEYNAVSETSEIINNYRAELFETKKRREERMVSYDWLMSYSGINPKILSYKETVMKYDLHPYQIQDAKTLIARENIPAHKKSELEFMMDKLIEAYPANTMYPSIKNWFLSRGSVSSKQEWRIRHDYKAIPQ